MTSEADLRTIARRLAEEMARERLVEGISLVGSLAAGRADEVADIDLVVATQDSPQAIPAAREAIHRCLRTIGSPLAVQWFLVANRQTMLSALFGKRHFPPAGLRIDLIISRMQDLGQMTWNRSEIMFDRTGALAVALEDVPTALSREELVALLRRHLLRFPFLVHDARKALRRGDLGHLSHLMTNMRLAVLSVVAAQARTLAKDGKDTWHLVSSAEKPVLLAATGSAADEATIRSIAELLLVRLAMLPKEDGLEPEIGTLSRQLAELL